MPNTRGTISFALLVALLAGTAHGQSAPAEEGPVVVGERTEEYKWFDLDHWNAALDLFGQRRNERRSQAGQRALTDTETLFRETLDLSGEAFVGHKNLLDLTGNVKFGLEDTFLNSETTGLNEHDSTFANLYDLNGLLFQQGPAPTNIYSRRDESLLYREFGGSVKTTTTESGLATQLNSLSVPTTFQYFHREQNEHDPTQLTAFGAIQDTAALHSGTQLGRTQHLTFDYTLDNVRESQTFLAPNSYTRHDATLTHTLDFGPEDKHNLRSTLRYYDQGGVASQSILRLDEQMQLRHTDRFETRYNLTLEDQKLSGTDQRLARASVTARHHLFESLTSTATLDASRQDVPNEFESDEVFAEGGLEYTKKVPKGRIDASINAGVNRQNNGARGTTIAAPEGTFVFNDPFALTISQRNIVPSSVVVRDVSGLRVYFEGFDYILEAFPDRIELRRIVGGAIADGQAVRIRYDVGPEPSNQIDTETLTVALRYTLTETWAKGLSPYFIYRKIEHQLDAVDPSRFVLDDVQSLQYGLEYELDALKLKIERENRDSTVQPLDANRFEVSYDRRMGQLTSVNARASREELDYRRTGDRIELNRITGRVSHHFAESFDAALRLEFRDEKSTFNGHLRGIEEDAEVTWRRGRTTVYGSLRNAILNGDVVDTFSQTIVVGIKRDF